jgi:hypothetical protein
LLDKNSKKMQIVKKQKQIEKKPSATGFWLVSLVAPLF